MYMSEHKILLLATYRRGGVEKFCQMLLNHLSADFQTDLLTIGNRLYQGTWQNFITKIFDLAHAGYRLITGLKNGHYDIVHINPSFKVYPLLRDSLYLLIINRLGYGNRTVVFFHGWDGNLAERIASHAFYKKIFGKLYKEVGAIFVLYNRCKEQLVNIGIAPEKIKVTTMMYERIDGLDEGSIQQVNGKVNILFMSLLIKGKGVFVAAEVAKLLVENGYHNTRLILAGDGPLLPELKQFITKNNLAGYVEIPGYVSGREKAEILSKGDIFLFPTQLPEGCPTVIIEAMGAGQAIVSTLKGAIPSLIKEEENGFICDSQDPAVFYEAVKKLLDNRELLNKMQKTNQKKAEKNYEVKGYVRRMEEVYLSLIGRTTSLGSV